MNLSVLEDSILSEMDASQIQNSLLRVCELLNANVKNFDWVGFYIMDHTNKQLHLGPYTGESTDHIIIPFGKGICGQVAVSGQTYIADDVNSESNYIACSINVKSEIVIPIYSGEELVAQLDIDSHVKGAFSSELEEFLQRLCKKLGNLFGHRLAYEQFLTPENP